MLERVAHSRECAFDYGLHYSIEPVSSSATRLSRLVYEAQLADPSEYIRPSSLFEAMPFAEDWVGQRRQTFIQLPCDGHPENCSSLLPSFTTFSIQPRDILRQKLDDWQPEPIKLTYFVLDISAKFLSSGMTFSL